MEQGLLYQDGCFLFESQIGGLCTRKGVHTQHTQAGGVEAQAPQGLCPLTPPPPWLAAPESLTTGLHFFRLPFCSFQALKEIWRGISKDLIINRRP